VYPDVPQSEDELHSMSPQTPLEQAWLVEQVCLSFAVELFVQLALTVPWLLQVYVL
jgi:hypothetical protein